MRAAVCREYGPPEVVRVEDLPPPALGPGQVRVGVRAAAVSYPDVLLVAGEYQVRLPVPFVPGSEYAGVVTEVAAGVARPRVGDRVFGTTMAGAFGTEIVVPAGPGHAGRARRPGGGRLRRRAPYRLPRTALGGLPAARGGARGARRRRRRRPGCRADRRPHGGHGDRGRVVVGQARRGGGQRGPVPRRPHRRRPARGAAPDAARRCGRGGRPGGR